MAGKKVVMSEEQPTEEEAVPMSEEEKYVEEQEDPETEEDEDEDEGPTSLADLDPAELLWQPDGPTIGQILEWKELHGENNIFVVALTVDKNVVYRTLARPEYRQLIRDMEEAAARGQLSGPEVQLFQEEYITDLCTLYHNGGAAAEDMAGMATIVAAQVMDVSGFQPLEIRQL